MDGSRGFPGIGNPFPLPCLPGGAGKGLPTLGGVGIASLGVLGEYSGGKLGTWY